MAESNGHQMAAKTAIGESELAKTRPDTATILGRYPPVSRSAYDTVDAEHRVQSSSSSGDGGKAPIITNVYQLVPEAVVGQGKETDKAISAASIKVSQPEELSLKLSHRLVPRHQQQSRLGTIFFEYRTLITTCCGLILGIILLIPLIAVGAYFLVYADENADKRVTRAEKHYRIDRATYGYESCASWFRNQPGVDLECVVVRRPSKTLTCKTLSCELTIFTAGRRIGGPASAGHWKPSRATQSASVNTTLPTFCIAPASSDNHIDVCISGRCDHHYFGGQRLYDDSELQGQWVDNCDEPSPCWKIPERQRKIFDQSVFQRTWCTNASGNASCPSDGVTAAVVWLQHKTCLMNGDQVGTFCSGLPVEIWECETCTANVPNRSIISSYNYTKICETYRPGAIFINRTGCVITCASGQRVEVPLPTGTACESDQERAEGRYAYCAFGLCLEVEQSHREGKWDHSDIDLDQCVQNLAAIRANLTKRFDAFPSPLGH